MNNFIAISLRAVLLISLFGFHALGDNTSLIKEFLGSYPVLESNKVLGTGGWLVIQADESQLGIHLRPLPLATPTLAQYKLLTPKDRTKVERQGQTVIQQFVNGEERVRIEYLRHEGFLEVFSKHCFKEDCREIRSLGTTGKSPGTAIGVKEFFKSIENENYKIGLAGGVKPKDGNDIASVYLDTEEAILSMPYCQPNATSCDPGYQYFPYKDSRVFRRETTTGAWFVLFGTVDNKLRYFVWEEKPGEIIFHNYQYSIAGETVYLEHVIKTKVN